MFFKDSSKKTPSGKTALSFRPIQCSFKTPMAIFGEIPSGGGKTAQARSVASTPLGRTPHGRIRVPDDGTTGVDPKAKISGRVSLPSYARSTISDTSFTGLPSRFSTLRPSGRSSACPGERENLMAVRASAATI